MSHRFERRIGCPGRWGMCSFCCAGTWWVWRDSMIGFGVFIADGTGSEGRGLLI